MGHLGRSDRSRPTPSRSRGGGRGRRKPLPEGEEGGLKRKRPRPPTPRGLVGFGPPGPAPWASKMALEPPKTASGLAPWTIFDYVCVFDADTRSRGLWKSHAESRGSARERPGIPLVGGTCFCFVELRFGRVFAPQFSSRARVFIYLSQKARPTPRETSRAQDAPR